MNESEASGIAVLGPFRSGTSLTCRILSRMGVDFGPEAAMHSPDLFSPRGYLQRTDVGQANNRLMRSTGMPVEPELWPWTIAPCPDGITLLFSASNSACIALRVSRGNAWKASQTRPSKFSPSRASAQ